MDLAEVGERPDTREGRRERVTRGEETRTRRVIREAIVDGPGCPARDCMRISAGDPGDDGAHGNRELGPTSGYGKFVVPSLDRDSRARDQSSAGRGQDQEGDDDAERRKPTRAPATSDDGLQGMHHHEIRPADQIGSRRSDRIPPIRCLVPVVQTSTAGGAPFSVTRDQAGGRHAIETRVSRSHRTPRVDHPGGIRRQSPHGSLRRTRRRVAGGSTSRNRRDRRSNRRDLRGRFDDLVCRSVQRPVRGAGSRPHSCRCEWRQRRRDPAARRFGQSDGRDTHGHQLHPERGHHHVRPGRGRDQGRWDLRQPPYRREPRR